MEDIRIPIFKAFEGCVFPGDITGYILPVTERTIFRSYVDVPNNDNPFLIALTFEGHFICKHKGCDYWVTVDSIPSMEGLTELDFENGNVNHLGFLDYEGNYESVWTVK
jgi:hypothetical protein